METAPHPLDNPIWNALATRQAAIAIGNPNARRYPADTAPFAATLDTTQRSLIALQDMMSPSSTVAMFTPTAFTPPDGLRTVFAATAEQMIGPATAPWPIEPSVAVLGPADGPQMMALAEKTKPGPFGPRTRELGQFLGVSVDGRLVAMAGERMKLPGFTEISAVCTDPEFRGRGYGRTLLQAVARAVLTRGETPFLHVFSDNQTALSLYQASGFVIRRRMHLTVLTKPTD